MIQNHINQTSGLTTFSMFIVDCSRREYENHINETSQSCFHVVQSIQLWPCS